MFDKYISIRPWKIYELYSWALSISRKDTAKAKRILNVYYKMLNNLTDNERQRTIRMAEYAERQYKILGLI